MRQATSADGVGAAMQGSTAGRATRPHLVHREGHEDGAAREWLDDVERGAREEQHVRDSVAPRGDRRGGDVAPVGLVRRQHLG